MNILFYVEPHPIRNSQTHFIDIAKWFLPLIHGSIDIDARLYANKSTLSQLNEKQINEYKEKIIHPTAAEEALFKDLSVEWVTEGIPAWIDLIQGRSVAIHYKNILRRIYSGFQFDCIVHWGENGAIASFSRENNIPHIAMELGCTRPPFLNSLAMDTWGSNGSSMIPKLSIDEIKEIVNSKKMSRHRAMFLHTGKTDMHAYDSIFSPIQPDLSSQLLKKNKLVFLPLQLSDDANLLCFSPYKTITEVVLAVVPILAKNGYTVIIKPHPGAKHRPNALMENTMARNAITSWEKNVIWCDRPDIKYHNAQIIQACDFTVTVNSSVGFEALYFDKPVVVLGDAVYKPTGIFPSLQQAIDGSFDKQAYIENISYLREFLLTAYLKPHKLLHDPSAFFSHIKLLAKLANQQHSPQESAKVLYAIATTTEYLPHNYNGLFGMGTFSNSTPLPPPQQQALSDTINPDYCSFLFNILRKLPSKSPSSLALWISERSSSNPGISEIIEAAEVTDVSFYNEKYPDVVATGIDAAHHYSKYGIFEKRQPRASIHPTPSDFLTNLKNCAKLISLHTPPKHPLTPDETYARKTSLTIIKSLLSSRKNPYCVVLHAYYADLASEIIKELEKLPKDSFDLIVTIPDWGNKKIIEAITNDYPDAIFYATPNRGRDIGPFLDLLPTILEKNYSLILKIQTKRGYFKNNTLVPEFGKIWRDQTLNALLGSQEKVASIISEFSCKPTLNMVGPQPYALSIENYPYHDGGNLAEILLQKRAKNPIFFAGTMFWVRPSCLSPFTTADLDISSFEPETGQNDGALAHLIERILGEVASIDGSDGICATSADCTDSAIYPISPAKSSIDDYLTLQLTKIRRNINSAPPLKTAI